MIGALRSTNEARSGASLPMEVLSEMVNDGVLELESYRSTLITLKERFEIGSHNMPIVNLIGIEIDVDEDGFIQDASTWTRELATAIAQERR